MEPNFVAVRLVLTTALALAAPALAFDLQGHRGARGLAPENTLAAFRTALALGVDTLELDVGLSRDGQVVVAHDSRLNPNLTRDELGRWLAEPGAPLHTLSLAELGKFDVGRIKPGTRYARTYPEQQPADGERMPTLESVFAYVRAAGNTRVRFNIETKVNPLEPEASATPEALTRALLAVVERAGVAARITVQSFDWRTLRLVQRWAPGIDTGALTVKQSFLDNLSDARWTAGLQLAEHDNSVPRLVAASGAKVWSPYHAELSQASLAEARALGLRVVPWTVNAPEQIERLLGWGVDGIISDYPDRVLKLLQRRGGAPAR